jgi:ankyrin repeat protein
MDEKILDYLVNEMYENNVAEVEKILSEHPELLNARYGDETLLHVAARSCCLECVKRLIEKGLSPNAKDGRGRTPLDSAAMSGCYEAVEELLKYVTPTVATIWEAAWTGEDYEERRKIVMLLAALGPEGGSEIISQYVHKPCGLLEGAIARKDYTLIHILYRFGITPEACYRDCYYIHRIEDDEVLKWLIERRYICLTINYIDHLRRIAKIKPDYVDVRGNTLLHYAAEVCDVELLQQLLDKVNSEVKNIEGKTALDIAAAKGCIDAVTLLLSRVKPTRETLLSAKKDALKVILEYYGPEILNLAPERFDELLKENYELLKHVNINARAKDGEGTTVLHRAVKRRDVEAVKKVLEIGANPNIGDKRGYTALHYAVIYYRRAVGDEWKAIIKMLLDAGADPSIPGHDGRTPLQLAEEFGYTELVPLLLKRS